MPPFIAHIWNTYIKSNFVSHVFNTMKFIYLLILFKIIILCTRNSAFQLQVALFSINISTYLQLVRPLSRAVSPNSEDLR